MRHPRPTTTRVLAVVLTGVLAVLAALFPLTTAAARGSPSQAEERLQPDTPVRFRWPVVPPHSVLRPFDAPASPYGQGHRGADLGGTVGEPVVAAADGVVVFAGQVVNRGVVSVAHTNGLRTTYEPIAPSVTAGQRIEAGAVLGHLRPGHRGCLGAPACLHWGVRRGGVYLDPLALVTTGRVRLLPWKEDAGPN